MSQRFSTVFEVEDTGTQTVVRFIGQKVRLGEQHMHILEEELPKLISEYGRAELTLHLGNVECLASTALGHLIRLNERLHHLGGRLCLEGVTPYVRELLQLANLEHIFDLDPMTDAALG